MVKGKAAASDVRVPQNRDEAAAMIKEFGDAQREVERVETAMKESLAKVKADAEKEAAAHVETAKQLFAGLKLYCEANRQTLLAETGIKTVDFGTGTVSWRWKPSRVSLRGEVAEIIKRIHAKISEASARGDVAATANYGNFLRVTTEVDKEGMLKNADLARTIEGVTVGRSGEVFEIEPFAPQLAESAA